MNRFALVVVIAVVVASVAAQYARWLRVAQREHYIPGSATVFSMRWSRQPRQLAVDIVTTLAAIVGFRWAPPLGVSVVALQGVVSPLGLSLRGRTSRLMWTRRLKTLGATALTLHVVLVVIAVVVGMHVPVAGWLVVILALLLVPTFIDAAAWITSPLERRLAQRFVNSAAQRLAHVNPQVVAVTGSYGKTSTKHHIAELLGASAGVVPTPKSFNNRAGLSRAINENLVDGTRIFIAEMGTYGPGEIADLCAWCPPDIAVVTAIGPVHLERMKTLDTIETAKFEITEHARAVVLNGDDERLATWVEPLRRSGKTVITAGTSLDCDVAVLAASERWKIFRRGEQVAELLPVAGVRPTNVACALAVAFEVGLDVYDVATRVSHLTPPQHRLTVVRAPSGLTVIDDTFNANPASSRVALHTLCEVPVSGRRVVVTPGLVELGRSQAEENQQLGAYVRDAGCELIVVASTNAKALTKGFGESTRHVSTREKAVSWVRANLHGDDAVLYLNDLPDHYP